MGSFHLLGPSLSEIASVIHIQSKAHVIANLVVFMPPRYTKLSARSLGVYLELLCALLDSIPLDAFEPLSSDNSSWTLDGDEDEATPLSNARSAVALKIDNKTRARLHTLPSRNHLLSLVTASASHTSARLTLYKFLLSLYTAWPAHKNSISNVMITFSGGGMIRELYKGHVRTSPLGRTDEPKVLIGMTLRLILKTYVLNVSVFIDRQSQRCALVTVVVSYGYLCGMPPYDVRRRILLFLEPGRSCVGDGKKSFDN